MSSTCAGSEPTAAAKVRLINESSAGATTHYLDSFHLSQTRRIQFGLRLGVTCGPAVIGEGATGSALSSIRRQLGHDRAHHAITPLGMKRVQLGLNAPHAVLEMLSEQGLGP